MTDKMEPPGSASSSPDEKCVTCGHYRSTHGSGACLACRSPERHHPFAPADAETAGASWVSWEETKRQATETAGEPEAPDCWACKHAEHRAFNCSEQLDGDDCGCGANAPTAAQEAATQELTDLRQEMEATEPEAHEHNWTKWGAVYHGGYYQWRDCQSCPATESRNEWPSGPDADPEPEAPECATCGQRAGDWFDRSVCAEPCGSAHSRCANCGAVTGDACLNEAPAAPPRRPPYAVAYETEGGAQYEIALPGDATIRAHEGALIITHASAVLALTQARPMEAP